MTRQNTVYILAFISIFLMPLSAVVPIGPHVWYVQMIFLMGLFCVGISLNLWKFNKWLSFLSLVATYSTLVTANQGLRSLFFLFMFQMALLASFQISKLSKRQRKTLLEGIVVLVFIQAFWVFLQQLNLDPIFDSLKDPKIDDTVGFSASRNQIGLFFGITSPLVFYYAWPLLILNILGVWISSTTSSMVGMIFGCLVAGWFRGNKYFKYLIVVFILSTCIFFLKYENFATDSYKERFNLVKHSIKEVVSGKALMRIEDKFNLIQTRPFEGFGLGNFISISPYTQWQFMDNVPYEGQKPQHRYEHVHNDFIEVFYEMGLAGLIGVVGLVISFIVSFIRAKKSPVLIISFSCIVAYLVSALGIYTIYTALSGMLLIIFYGIYRGELNGQTAATS